MPPKKQIKIDTEINEIVIINNKKLTPYLELVNFSSRNIDQKKLGTILGIFEIKDLSDDSAYIVNFLASVAKKTYFASHQKTPEESFESTLTKVNLSLSEIAKHGNVNWIGKIDAVLCSIAENQINFSVSGDAKVLLLRNGSLMEISNDLSPKDEAANPLKTFTDIASGRLEAGDKLILTTDDISHVFTLEELEKNANSFDKNKFVRFIKTALVNELDIAGTMIIDAKERIEENKKAILTEEEIDTPPEVTDINLFGNKIFEEKNKPKEKSAQKENGLPEKESEAEYTNSKTGHIYISSSEENIPPQPENKFEEWVHISKEKISDFGFWFNENYIKKGSYKIKKQLSQIFKKNPPSSQPTPTVTEMPTPKIPSQEVALPTPKLQERPVPIKTKTSFPEKKVETIPKTSLTPNQRFKQIMAQVGESEKITPNQKRVNQKQDIDDFFSRKKYSVPIQKSQKIEVHSSRNFGKFSLENYLKPIKNLFLFLIPKAVSIKENFLKMNIKFKLITLGIILAIFIIPFFIFKNDSSVIEVQTPAPANNSEDDLKINPSSQSYKEATGLYESKNLIGTLVFEDSIFAIENNKIKEINSQKEYSFPDNFRGAKLYSYMGDLGLLFILNEENKIISFSPISLKFKEEAIEISSSSKVEAIESYLTYLYVVDSGNQQIYRYPRADNGFGSKTDWLQSTISFENISGMAIDGNLYLSNNNSVAKLFNRKTQDFELKKDSDSSIDEIFTNEDIKYIYVLDNKNGELDRYDKDGNKQSFVSNQELTKATKMWVDEKNSFTYFITDVGLFRISNPQ